MKPEWREVNFIFNPKGGSSKSVTADYITLNPEFNALLAPQLASPERWIAEFIDQLEQYVSLNKVYPTTIIIDITRNENNSNVEALYSTIENIKNGRVDSTFYGRFKRLRFKSPHIIVFTNNVPNMSALSSERFNLFALADKDHDYTIVKCEVKLKIETYSKSLVTWYYKARVSGDQDQQNFYEKILNAIMTKIVMSGYLYYSYSSCLSQEEENEINERVIESQEQFCKGFNKGLKVSFIIYSIYLLTTTVVDANDQCPEPAKSPSSESGKELVKPKPYFKPVPAGVKGVAIGGVEGVCTAALQIGDFILGLMCAMLLIGIGVINNRE